MSPVEIPGVCREPFEVVGRIATGWIVGVEHMGGRCMVSMVAVKVEGIGALVVVGV